MVEKFFPGPPSSVTGKDLRHKRRQFDLPGEMVCKRAGISRSRLSAIERGYLLPSGEEAQRIASAIKDLRRRQRKLRLLASRLHCQDLV
jgi:predicted transcriptional regulator